MPLDTSTARQIIIFGQTLFSSTEYLNFLLSLPDEHLSSFIKAFVDHLEKFQEYQDDQLIADFSKIINDQVYDSEVKEILNRKVILSIY